MQIDIHTSLASHKKIVKNSKDLLDLISDILNRYKYEDMNGGIDMKKIYSKRYKFNFESRKDALKCFRALKIMEEKGDKIIGYGIDEDEPKKIFLIEMIEEDC